MGNIGDNEAVGCVDWEKIKQEYIAGGAEASYRLLAQKYGVSVYSLRHRAVAESWTGLRKKAREKKDTLIAVNIGRVEAKKEINRSRRIDGVADKLIDKLASNIDILVKDSKSLREVVAALKDLKDIKGFKSQKDLEEQQARIDKLRHDIEGSNGNEGVITVTFNDAGEDEWNE